MLTGTALLLCLVLALICFILATFGVKGPAGGWQPVGLAFFVLAFFPEISL